MNEMMNNECMTTGSTSTAGAIKSNYCSFRKTYAVWTLKIHICGKFQWPNQSEITNLLYMGQSSKYLNYAKTQVA